MAGSNTPKVTIGLPVYNAEANVAEAIREFQAQDFEDFEVVISDNNSTDATYDICAAYVSADKRFRLERQTRNIGANRNFDYVLSRARGELFMWAAAGDHRAPSFVRRCAEALAANPGAVLATPNVRLAYPPPQASQIFAYSEDVTHPHVIRRLRWILRAGAWFAIYGLIRRDALDRTRPITSLGPTPAPGLGPDYRVVELALLGPFARVPETLFEYSMRHPEPADILRQRLDPNARFRGTMFWWWLKDFWYMSGRHGFDLVSRLKIQAEYLASARSRGSLHTEFLRYNSEFQDAARRDRQWAKVANFFLERCILGGVRNALGKD